MRYAALLALRPWTRHSLVLAVLGVVFICIGASYVLTPPTNSRESSLRIALDWAPLWLWGLAFIATGLLAILSSRWPPASEKWGYSTLSGLTTLWGCWYGMAPFFGASWSSLTAMLAWWAVAFLIWAIAGLENPAAEEQ